MDKRLNRHFTEVFRANKNIKWSSNSGVITMRNHLHTHQMAQVEKLLTKSWREHEAGGTLTQYWESVNTNSLLGKWYISQLSCPAILLRNIQEKCMHLSCKTSIRSYAAALIPWPHPKNNPKSVTSGMDKQVVVY